MRHMLVFVLVICMVGAVSAAELGNQIPPKSDTHVLQNPAYDREGGENIGSAVPIPGLPFNDTGATCDNIDDYDEVCPYTGSTSPDVVYSLTLTDPYAVTVDLCGSLYDTKTFIYDSSQNLVACNDDYYYDDVCGYYTSALFDIVMAPGTYYIVIDGYYGDCGDYTLAVTGVPYIPCVLECPAGADHEGEPELMDGYQDMWNGGCNSTEFGTPFQDLCGQSNEPYLEFCGISGWYDDGFRDTDWFTVLLWEDGAGYIDCNIDAEQGTYLFELFPQNCASVAVAQLVQVVGGCAPVSMQVFGAPGDLVWLWVGPDDFYPPAGFVGHEYDYILTIDGIEPCIVATEDATWSDIKGLYR